MTIMRSSLTRIVVRIRSIPRRIRSVTAVSTSRWDLEETFLHEVDRGRPVSLELGTYNIATKTFRLAGTLSGPDDIHTTAVSQDCETYILVEMSQDPVIRPPIDFDFERLPPEDKQKIRERGIHISELITYDVRSGVSRRFPIPNGPAHIEWDDMEENVFYLSSHNLVTNNDTLYCFGNTRIDRFCLVAGGIELERSYESEDLLRGPSHKLLRYNGSGYTVIPVFPNQIHIVNLETMTLYKRINLSRRPSSRPNLSGGPIRYPPSSEDKTPYTISTVNGTPFLYLSSVWNVTAFDFESERKLGSVFYNPNKPMILMGHASQFDLCYPLRSQKSSSEGGAGRSLSPHLGRRTIDP